VIPTTTAHRQRARDTIVASARLTTTTRRRIARDGGADARANFDSFSLACARGWACVARGVVARVRSIVSPMRVDIARRISGG
jgi:hypothetical protein